MAIIHEWLGNFEQPVIVTTTAFRSGFDYRYIRWVIHIDTPRRLSDFLQASGRAGRAGQLVTSIVFLLNMWTPSFDVYETPDYEAMELYLTCKHCYCRVLNQFLDIPTY